MRFPLLLLGYATGIVSADHAPPLPQAALFLPAAFLLLCWLLLRHHERSGFSLLCLLSLALGIILYDLDRYPCVTDDHLLRFADQAAVTLDGRILAAVPRSGSGYAIDLAGARIIAGEREIPVHGRVRLTVETGEDRWNPGDEIRFRTRLRTPRPFGTPGEFDLGRHLATRGIFVTAFVPKSDDILLLRAAPAAERGWIERGRTATARFIATSTSPAYAPLVRALAIGDKSGLPPEIGDLLARGGVSHLFAISGLNLTMIAVAVYAVGLHLCRRSTTLLLATPPARLLPWLIAPLLVLYLLWTGAEFSTQRALLMALAVSLLFLLRRRTDPLNTLWFAAFAILLCEPLALFTPSFQLSFAALAGILLGYRLWQPLTAGLSKTAGYVATLFCSSLAATLATLPLVIFHFHLAAPAGIVTNLIAIPLIGWFGVPPALAGSLLWPLWPTAAGHLFAASEAVVAAMLAIVEAVLSVPLLSGWAIYPSLPLLGALTLLTLALLLRTGGRRPRLLLAGAALGCLGIAALPKEGLSVTDISVGQGEALLVTAGNRAYLIDGGGLYGDRLDTGRQLVAPALGRLGIHRLEAVILTHNHPDHAKGLVGILADLPCRHLIVGSPLRPDDPLAQVARARQVEIVLAPPGWSPLLEDGKLAIALYRPPEGASGEENDRSLVTYARYGGQGVLLPGDLGAQGVQALLSALPVGPVTLLKLPHHGSEHSTPALLLDRLQPQATFASVGYDNRFGFPHRSVVSDLETRRIPLARTDRDGSFRFVAGSNGWRFEKLHRGFLIDTTVASLLQNFGLSNN